MLNGSTKAEIDGQTYTLRLDINAMADFEGATGKPAFDALEDLEAGRATVTDMRAMFWALCQAHHPDVDLRKAGVLLSQAPQAMGKAIAAAMPKPKEGAEANEGNAPAAARTAKS